MAQKTLVLLGVLLPVLPLAAVPPDSPVPFETQPNYSAIPSKLRPYLKDYQAPGTRIRAGFVPDKPQLVWGEPLQVTFTVENLGPKDFDFMFGGDYRGTGRHDRFKITIRDAAGRVLLDPHANAPNFGGIMSQQNLTAGKTFTNIIDLSRFRTIPGAGTYSIECNFAFDSWAGAKGPSKPEVSSRFPLVLLERTPERVKQILDELVATAQLAQETDLGPALAQIVQFGQDEAVPRLVGLAEKGPVPRRAAAMAALGQISTDASLEAAMAGLKHAIPAMRERRRGPWEHSRSPAASKSCSRRCPGKSLP